MSNIKKGKQVLVIPKNLVDILSQEDKEKILKKEVVDTFSTAATRNERARKNKWLRWKYFDDLDKEHDWLSDHIIEDMGWAIGRRIYDKEEIEVKSQTLWHLLRKESKESTENNDSL